MKAQRTVTLTEYEAETLTTWISGTFSSHDEQELRDIMGGTQGVNAISRVQRKVRDAFAHIAIRAGDSNSTHREGE